MSNPVVAHLFGGTTEVYINLDQVIKADSPQLRLGPNTLYMADGTTIIVVETYHDLAGFLHSTPPGFGH